MHNDYKRVTLMNVKNVKNHLYKTVKRCYTNLQIGR